MWTLSGQHRLGWGAVWGPPGAGRWRTRSTLVFAASERRVAEGPVGCESASSSLGSRCGQAPQEPLVLPAPSRGLAPTSRPREAQRQARGSQRPQVLSRQLRLWAQLPGPPPPRPPPAWRAPLLLLLLGTLPGRVSSVIGDRRRSQNAGSGLPHPVFQLGAPGEVHVVKGEQRPGWALGASAQSLRWLPLARAVCRWMELPGGGPRTPSGPTPTAGQTVINEANLSAPGAAGGVEEGRPSICLGCQGNCLQPGHVPPAVPPC